MPRCGGPKSLNALRQGPPGPSGGGGGGAVGPGGAVQLSDGAGNFVAGTVPLFIDVTTGELSTFALNIAFDDAELNVNTFYSQSDAEIDGLVFLTDRVMIGPGTADNGATSLQVDGGGYVLGGFEAGNNTLDDGSDNAIIAGNFETSGGALVTGPGTVTVNGGLTAEVYTGGFFQGSGIAIGGQLGDGVYPIAGGLGSVTITDGVIFAIS